MLGRKHSLPLPCGLARRDNVGCQPLRRSAGASQIRSMHDAFDEKSPVICAKCVRDSNNCGEENPTYTDKEIKSCCDIMHFTPSQNKEDQTKYPKPDLYPLHH
ncbi:hypothetical protein Fot_06314 [Forsythia ovata]|uniref:Uncharacterized protein n=1 Tax=Forsythia ovata TaxID=205694 RepID=A0ABD1WWR6_9LAMI